jgi:hypothetical protein
MIPMVGYDASYRRGAFAVEGDQNGDLSGMAYFRLDDAVEWATKSVLGKKDGRWMIQKKRVGFQNDDIAIELMVIVPAGPNQRDELFAAIDCFEEAMETRLGVPTNKAFRHVEPPICIQCGQTANHVRVKLRDGQAEEKKYFCEIHARDQSEFDYSKTNRYSTANHSNLSWKQLDPANA